MFLPKVALTIALLASHASAAVTFVHSLDTLPPIAAPLVTRSMGEEHFAKSARNDWQDLKIGTHCNALYSSTLAELLCGLVVQLDTHSEARLGLSCDANMLGLCGIDLSNSRGLAIELDPEDGIEGSDAADSKLNILDAIDAPSPIKSPFAPFVASRR